jgi:hypothetical protein
MIHPYACARKIDAAAIASATRKDGAASEPAQTSPAHPPAVDEEEDEPVELLPPAGIVTTAAGLVARVRRRTRREVPQHHRGPDGCGVQPLIDSGKHTVTGSLCAGR